MGDPRWLALGLFFGAAALADTIIQTPEDLIPILGWIDEGFLWYLTFDSFYAYFTNRRFPLG